MQPGQKFANGRFVLVRLLGRGGMGEVWLARDERLQEDVALKFLPSEIRADPVALDDLRRETARSHKLTHPNIVRIHDLHEDADGTAFIVMEYVDGWTLAAVRLHQADRVLPWYYLSPLVGQLCAALDYAHGKKVIHRDLKPANMMVDSQGRLKLADFGIAATASDSMSRVSAQKTTSGTLLYMSPQQLTGKRAQPTDDIYALGATLYELLTSQPPFVSGDITHQILHETPEPVEDRLAALGIVSPVPGDVSAMIMACLAKQPEQRPQSAAAVAGWIGLGTPARSPAEVFAASVVSDGGKDAPGQTDPVESSGKSGKGKAAAIRVLKVTWSVMAVIGLLVVSLVIYRFCYWRFRLHHVVARPAQTASVPVVSMPVSYADFPPDLRLKLDELNKKIKTGGGFSIVGRVMFSDSALINSGEDVQVNFQNGVDAPSQIYPGGWFIMDRPLSTRYGAGGHLVLRAFSYDPVDFPMTDATNGITYLGFVMNRSTPQNLTTIQGTVNDAHELPVHAAKVALYFPMASYGIGNQPYKTMTTAADGKFSLAALAPNKYELVASSPGTVYDFKLFSLQPGQTMETNLTLYSPRKITFDYVCQGDDSRSFTNGGLLRGTLTWVVGSGGMHFLQQRASQNYPDDLRLEQIENKLDFRCFYGGMHGNGFYDAGAVDFDSVKDADQAGYSMQQEPCVPGHVYVVKTYDGHYAKMLLKND